MTWRWKPEVALEFRDGIGRGLTPELEQRYARFLEEYTRIRREEGRWNRDAEYYKNLPYTTPEDPLAWQWNIRAKTYDCLVRKVLPYLSARPGKSTRPETGSSEGDRPWTGAGRARLAADVGEEKKAGAEASGGQGAALHSPGTEPLDPGGASGGQGAALHSPGTEPLDPVGASGGQGAALHSPGTESLDPGGLRAERAEGDALPEESPLDPVLSEASPVEAPPLYFGASHVVPMASLGALPALSSHASLKIVDVGAGVGWLSHRLASLGHQPCAVDLSIDSEDGLLAARHYSPTWPRLQADFDHLPIASGEADAVVFNASLHYSVDYSVTLREALRVLRPGGTLIILETPIYKLETSGRQMVAERHAAFQKQHGTASDSIPSLEFLTWSRLRSLEQELRLRFRVVWPWYGWNWALRPLKAWWHGKREPSRFAILVAKAPA